MPNACCLRLPLHDEIISIGVMCGCTIDQVGELLIVVGTRPCVEWRSCTARHNNVRKAVVQVVRTSI